VLLQVVTERCRIQLIARHALPLRKLLGGLKKLVRNRNRRLHSRSGKSDRGTVSRTDRGVLGTRSINPLASRLRII
jgi:hypothetical protein